MNLVRRPLGDASFWAMMMTLYDYPYLDLFKDTQFIRVDTTRPSEYPYRAVVPNPIIHPLWPDFRICPNFPQICVAKDGRARVTLSQSINPDDSLEGLTFTCEKLGDYLLVPVPMSNNPVFVSRFLLYSDAWGPVVNDPQVRYNYLPVDGSYTNLTPQNIQRCTAWKKGKQKAFVEQCDTNTYTVKTYFNSFAGPTIRTAIKKYGHPIDSKGWRYLDVLLSDSGIISANKFGTSIDWCYATYWVVAYRDELGLFHPARSWKELEKWSGLKKSVLKHLVHKPDQDGRAIVFL